MSPANNHTDIASGADADHTTFNTPLGQLDAAIGAAVATLNTAAKTLVGAANELDAQIGAAASASGSLGVSIDTDGTLKAGAVDGATIIADNIVTDAKMATDVKVGSLAALTTTAKNSVIAALNELVAQIGAAALNELNSQLKMMFLTGTDLWSNQILTLQPNAVDGIDGNTRYYTPTTSYETSLSLYVRGNGASQCNTLLKFDLTKIPVGAIIVSATLSLCGYATQQAGNSIISAHRTLPANATWVEGCTWDRKDGSSVRWAGDVASNGGADAGCSVAGTDYASAVAGSFTVTALDAEKLQYSMALDLGEFALLQTANNGLVLTSNNASYFAFFNSSDTAFTYRPKLVVVYTARKVSVPPYYEKLQTVIGADLFRYFPLDEASGSVMHDYGIAGNGVGDYSVVVPPTLVQPGWDTALTATAFPANSYGNMCDSLFKAGINLTEFSVGFVFKPVDLAYWNSGVNHFLFSVYVDSNNWIYCRAAGNKYIVVGYMAGGVDKTVLIPASTTGSTQYTMTVSKSNDRLRVYVGGVLNQSEVTGLGTFAGNLNEERCIIGAFQAAASNFAALGSLQHFFYANRELTEAEVEKVAGPTLEDMPVVKALLLGDSKTFTPYGSLTSWRDKLRDAIYTAHYWLFKELPPALGRTGWTVPDTQAATTTDIAAMTDVPDWILINLGANDTSLTIDAAWLAAFCYIVDAYHAKFPIAKIRIAKVWRRDPGNGSVIAKIAAMNAYIDNNILPTRQAWLAVGMDEGTFLPGGDDGATNTADGVHYAEPGTVLVAAAWKTAMGY